MSMMNKEQIQRARCAARKAEIRAARDDGGVRRFRSMSERELIRDLGWASYVRDIVEDLEWVVFCTETGQLAKASENRG